MSEYVRSVTIHAEVDTNKQTYTLDLDVTDLEYAIQRVREFLVDHFPDYDTAWTP